MLELKKVARVAQTPQESIIRRLVLVKQMYFHAYSHSLDRTEPGRMFAIQAMDYCIETLLKTVVSKYGSPSDYHGAESAYYYPIASLRSQRYTPKMDFYRLWDEVVGIYRDPKNKIAEDAPPLHREIDIIHSLRNDVQHNGVIPSYEEAQKSINYTESFVRSVVKSAFGKEFDELMLADLIENTEIRDLMKEAEKALEENRFKDSVIASAKAFTKASMAEIRRRPYRSRLSPFIRSKVEDIGRRLELRDAFRELGSAFDDIREQIEYIEDQLEVISLGGDLRRYLRFKQKSPHVTPLGIGELDIYAPPDWEPTKEDCVEVLDFVFSTLLRWQSAPLEENRGW